MNTNRFIHISIIILGSCIFFDVLLMIYNNFETNKNQQQINTKIVNILALHDSLFTQESKNMAFLLKSHTNLQQQFLEHLQEENK